MAWKETTPLNERMRFIEDLQRELESMAELCRRYGISRKTGYKWKRRYEEEGLEGLQDRSRAALYCPHQTSEDVVQKIVEKRQLHPTWGAKKIRRLLERENSEAVWPARSTICSILKREGLIQTKRRRPRRGHPGRPTTTAEAPNQIWTADYKGQFKTRNGVYCYPLTIADLFSRYLIECRGLLSTHGHGAKRVFEKVFREYGLPDRIRTDNGVPFATSAIARLSKLSVWWLRLGIHPELIEPASPQQNGAHERMHRTLKAETTRPPAANCSRQQRRFDTFKDEFNNVRPHEALDLDTPASNYSTSTRPFPDKLPEIVYPDHYELRLVSKNGGIRWMGSHVPVSHTLEGEYIGLEEIDNGIWDVFFGTLLLGRLDERIMRIEDALGRNVRRRPNKT